MTRDELDSYARTNLNALQMIHNAVSDYIAARCLLVNGLFPGLVLAAQSVEKYFKGYILLLEPNKNTRKFAHNITDLKKEVQSLKDFKLDQFNDFLSRLEKHYLTRYPDNKNKSTSQSTGELIDLDELIIYLNENLPVPDEIKFRSGLYIKLFVHLEHKLPTMIPEGHWVITNNQPINLIIKELAIKYTLVKEHLYPNVTKEFSD